jgi:Lar family restriction alleviation protein
MASTPPLCRCPFCGVENPHLEETDVRSWAVVCGSCGTIGPVGNDEVQAIARWNWRPALTGATHPGKAKQIC